MIVQNITKYELQYICLYTEEMYMKGQTDGRIDFVKSSNTKILKKFIFLDIYYNEYRLYYNPATT